MTNLPDTPLSLKDDDLRELLKEEVSRITAEILGLARFNADNCDWLCGYGGQKGEIISDIYGGCAGIALFLAESYQVTPNNAALECAIKAARSLKFRYERDRPTDKSIYTGCLGLSYLFIRLSSITGEASFLDDAFKIASDHVDPDANKGVSVSDVLTGAAGIIWGLLHLYAIKQEKWVAKLIAAYTRRLYRNAEFYHGGIFWDRSPFNTGGLCGMSHGASGIGFTFLEVARWLGKPFLYEVADMAFAYERIAFSERVINWQDFRFNYGWPGKQEEAVQALIQGKMNHFTRPRFMNAWCHGAAGIGLARLRSYELRERLGDFEEFEKCVARVEHDRAGTSDKQVPGGLCHGEGGNGELFLEAYRVLEKEEYLHKAQQVAAKMIAKRKKVGYYQAGFGGKGNRLLTLFNGDSGTGYFYLRVLLPCVVPSLLAPEFGEPSNLIKMKPDDSLFTGGIKELQASLIKRAFPRTISAVRSLGLTLRFDINTLPRSISKTNDDFARWLSKTLRGKTKASIGDLNGIFNVEKQKLRLTTAYNNYALLFAKDLLHKAELSRNLSLSVNSLSRQSLYLDPDVRFIRIKGNSVRKESNPSRRTAKSKVSSIRYLMLRPNWAGVSETAISSGVFFLLQSFKQGARVSSIVREMENHFSGRNTVTRERALRQIAEAVSGGVLWRTNVIARYAVYRRNKMGRDNLLYYP